MNGTASASYSALDDLNRRCDQCGVPSEVVVSNQRFDMAFCGHHYRALATRLAERGFFPVEPETTSPEPVKPDVELPAREARCTDPKPTTIPQALLTKLTRQSSPGIFEETLTNADGRLTNSGNTPALVVFRMVGGRKVILEARSMIDGVLTDDGDLPALTTFDIHGRPHQVLRFRAGLLCDVLNPDGSVRAYAVVRMDPDGETVHVESWRHGVQQAGPQH